MGGVASLGIPLGGEAAGVGAAVTLTVTLVGGGVQVRSGVRGLTMTVSRMLDSRLFPPCVT